MPDLSASTDHAWGDPLDLLGRWRLTRVIQDRFAGEQHTVEGLLILTAVSTHRVSWAETGRWHRDAGDLEVSRALWLDRVPDAGWWMRFEDGRDFHPWTPGEPVTHPCAPDTYRGVVAGTPRRWTVDWEVTGPHKDYTMSTTLTRTT